MLAVVNDQRRRKNQQRPPRGRSSELHAELLEETYEGRLRLVGLERRVENHRDPNRLAGIRTVVDVKRRYSSLGMLTPVEYERVQRQNANAD